MNLSRKFFKSYPAVSTATEEAGLTGHMVITKQKIEEDFPDSRRMSTESLSSQDSNDSRVSIFFKNLMHEKIFAFLIMKSSISNQLKFDFCFYSFAWSNELYFYISSWKSQIFNCKLFPLIYGISYTSKSKEKNISNKITTRFLTIWFEAFSTYLADISQGLSSERE